MSNKRHGFKRLNSMKAGSFSSTFGTSDLKLKDILFKDKKVEAEPRPVKRKDDRKMSFQTDKTLENLSPEISPAMKDFALTEYDYFNLFT